MLIDTVEAITASVVQTARLYALGKSELAKVNFEAHQAELNRLQTAERYWLDVRQIEELRAAKLHIDEMPHFVHENLFIEFSGSLHFNFVPWIKAERDLTTTQRLKPNTKPDSAGTDYRGVHIFLSRPGSRKRWESGLPDEPVASTHWYEKPEGNAVDSYDFMFSRSSWPYMLGSSARQIGIDDTQHPGEAEHATRLLNMTINLLYFLAAENVVRVRIRPEHQRYGKQLAGLPKSDKPYYVLPFQLPRYRYLHEGSSERSVGVAFSVRGHIRHLRDECFSRNADGSVRTIWINEHARGLGNPIKPTVRVGTIDHLFLDYDAFIRQEENRKQKAAHV
jgi:hypothetical protein